MKDILQPLINEFMPFAQKRMGFKKPPRVFLRDDPDNAQNPLGKTAYYDPQQMSVTLYINGRHPKDIMRSLSHELVHHMQNCNGQFENTEDMGEGYAQNDPHLREMEREAYEIGNLCLRDWTDTRNGTIYNVSLQEGAKKKMSTKDWKNNELSTLLTEKWGFSFNLLTESQEEEVVEEAAEDETLNEEEEELEEGGAALRVGNEDRLEQRHAHSDRIHEEEELDEAEEIENKDKADLDDDGKLSGYEKARGAAIEKSMKNRGKMDEQKIRRIIRRLVKEAMAKKAK